VVRSKSAAAANNTRFANAGSRHTGAGAAGKCFIDNRGHGDNESISGANNRDASRANAAAGISKSSAENRAGDR
jgi:hypothetical protein